jgi:hypothetical protein
VSSTGSGTASPRTAGPGPSDLGQVRTVKGLIALGSPLPCRYCGLPSFLAEADEEKRLHPLHPCCRFWIGEQGALTCVACASFNARRKQTPVSARAERKIRELQAVSIPRTETSDDEMLLALLARLRHTNLWVDLRVLEELVGGRASMLLAEAMRANCVEARTSPVGGGAQYRICP